MITFLGLIALFTSIVSFIGGANFEGTIYGATCLIIFALSEIKDKL